VVDMHDLFESSLERYVDFHHPCFWCLWRHRNDVVFDGATPSVKTVKTRIKEEYERWPSAKFFRAECFRFLEPIPTR
jgi:hypothetical protein